MSRRIVPLTVLVIGLIAPAARAQIPFTRDMIPTRTALTRLGLERNWMAVVPLGVTHERVLLVSQSQNMLFAQTNLANLHAYDAETGRYLWGANLGRGTNVAHPASVNSNRVIVANNQDLWCLDKGTGRQVWKATLDHLPSTATACDEERAIVGLRDGKLVAYSIRDHSRDEPPGYSAATFLWAWKTNAPLSGRPLPANQVVAFGSQDARVYVARVDENTLIYRFLTGGPISASLAGFGTRTLLVPSEDHNLYAIDLFNGETRWVYPSGAPITQEPVVAGNEVFVENSQGALSSLDPETGTLRWEHYTGNAALLAISPGRVYLRSIDGDLLVVDRQTGRSIADAAATQERAGLNLRSFSLTPTNRVDDRMVFGTPSGLLVSIRETGQLQPSPLRDPNAEPFGVLPEGEESTPPQSPPAEETDAFEFQGFGQ